MQRAMIMGASYANKAGRRGKGQNVCTAEAGGTSPAHRPLFGWWTGNGGGASGAFLHTPPYPLLLTAVPADVAAGLGTVLAGRPLSGVNAYPEAAQRFAAAWRDAAGCV